MKGSEGIDFHVQTTAAQANELFRGLADADDATGVRAALTSDPRGTLERYGVTGLPEDFFLGDVELPPPGAVSAAVELLKESQFEEAACVFARRFGPVFAIIMRFNPIFRPPC